MSARTRAGLAQGCMLLLLACGSARGPETESTMPTSANEGSTSPARDDGGASSPRLDAQAVDGAARADAGGDVQTLFDGTLTADWRMSTITNQPGRDDPGHFTVQNGALVAHPGTDLGLLWNTRPTPPDFLLELEWMLSAPDDNSGIFVRFPNLDEKGYDNTAWVAIDFGFEIQINEPGVPDGAPMHTTGAVYAQPDQAFTRVVANPPGTWNTFAIRVVGATFAVILNGQQVTSFASSLPARGLPSTQSAPSFIGLQTHTGNVAFRNIRIRSL